MENNLGRASWNQLHGNENYTHLRRPRSHPSQQQHHQQPTPISSLSPLAKEFVPQNQAQHLPQNVAPSGSYHMSIQQLPINVNMNMNQYHGGLHSNHLNNFHRIPMAGPPTGMPSGSGCPGMGQGGGPAMMGQGGGSRGASIQNRLNFGGRHHEYNMPPMNTQPAVNFDASQETASHQSDDEISALGYMEQIVKWIIEDPGVFDSVQDRLLTVFKGFAHNNYVLSNAIEIIFTQSIEEQNFRYMGAKLYRLLDSMVPERHSIFRNLLIMKLNFHQSEILNLMNHQQHSVRGTTLFLAELYMQLRNDGNRIKDIARNIVYTMDQLLQKTTPENIKCICLTLKLAGYELDMDCPAEIGKIITQLKAVNSIDVSTTRILETVLNLCKNNWGRSETIEPAPLPNNIVPNISDDTVLYGPDGQVMTEEENSFLEENISPYDAQNGDENEFDDLDDDTGMDPEMELAYKDFLKKSANYNKC